MTKLKDEVELLRSIPMLAVLPGNKLKLLAFASDKVSYRENEVLFEQGDNADSAYIVIEGEADVLVSFDEASPPTKVATLGPNSFVGDMAILGDMPRTATVKTNKPLEALRIRRDHMVQLINETPSLSMAILKELVKRLAKTTKDLSEAQEQVAKMKKEG